MDQNRKIQSSWTVQEKFDIYFSVLFNCYCQNLMSSRDTGHHLQGFRNSSKGWEGGGIRNYGGEDFLPNEKNLRRCDFWQFEPSSKLKKAFCEC